MNDKLTLLFRLKDFQNEFCPNCLEDYKLLINLLDDFKDETDEDINNLLKEIIHNINISNITPQEHIFNPLEELLNRNFVKY